MKSKEMRRKYSQKYYNSNIDKIRSKSREYYKKNIEKIRLRSLAATKRHNAKIKLKAFQIVSGLDKPQCRHCGCDELVILEINHINGDGRTDGLNSSGKRVRGGGAALYRKIVNKIRSIDDIEVTCKVCNIAHYVTRKYGVKYKIRRLP